MKLNSKLIKVLALLLFLICLRMGFQQAYHKPLWNDEIYTQSGVKVLSYGQMLLGNISEGNNCPLFYLIQKGIYDLMHYTELLEWKNGPWDSINLNSQIFLRINPVIFMSLAIVCIFYYFSRFYSIWAGLYSVIISLSSFMVWMFWAEARPYALWVFLTTLQSLVFLYLMREEGNQKKGWIWLTGIHFLLSLTVVFSVIQIASVAILLWIWSEKDWRKYIFLCIVPGILCVSYYMKAPKYEFWFKDGPLALVNASFPKDRMLIFSLFAFYLLLSHNRVQPYLPRSWKINFLDGQKKKEVQAYFLLTILMLLGCCLVLLKFKLQENALQNGFQISSRYFIYLTPIGIIATTLFSIDLVKASKNKVIQILIILILAVLVCARAHRTSLFFIST